MDDKEAGEIKVGMMVKGTEVYGVSIWNVVMYACIEYPYDVGIIFTTQHTYVIFTL